MIWYVSTSGSDASDGMSPSTAFATPAHAVSGAVAGDLIALGPGTFALGNAVLNVPDNVSMTGAGIDRTTLTSTASLVSLGAILKPGTNGIYQDFTIQGIASAGTYQAPFGTYYAASSPQTAFSNVTARRLKLIADSDGFYLGHTTALSLTSYDCQTLTKYDSFQCNANAAHVTTHYDLTIRSQGPSTNNSGLVTRGVAASYGTHYFHGGSILAMGATGTGADTAAVETGTGAATIYLLGVTLVSASGAGSVWDINAAGTSLIYIDGHTQFSRAKVNGANAITLLGGDVQGKVLGNGNSAIAGIGVQAAAAWSGPNSITLVFHDAGGNPVPNVTFMVSGIGSSTTDSTGQQTISLPAGNFTIKTIPTPGTLWPDTPITVSGNATITLTGTAIVIPAPSAPTQTTAYLTTRDGQGNAIGNMTLTFALVDPQQTIDAFDQTAFSVTSNGSGLLQVPLLKSTKYQARMPNGTWVAFTTGSGSTYALPEVLGTYG